MRKLVIVMLIALIGCSKTEKQSKEAKFWNWVVNHKTELETFITSEERDYNIYNQLSAELKNYNDILIPEMTLTSKDEVVLIISPDGLLDGIEPTEKLYNAKPKIDNWVIKKYRQARDKVDLNYEGVEYPSSNIQIVPEIDKERGKINVEVYIKNMNIDTKKYQSLAFLYLDHILGEYNTITKVGYIDFYHLENDKKIDNSITILELRKLIEKEL